ncbi:MAG: hypothetical protein HY015_01935 [Bacteroidetes bacterium]|nr:hypothetical protein [Bacteroidota bacterium]
MKKLDEIPKKNVFEVPDGYFDRLALKIQSRTEELSPVKSIPTWNLALRYVLPIVLIAVALIFIFKPKATQDTEHLLASVSSEQLVEYLNESDITEQDLLEAINFDDVDADSLSVQVQDEFMKNGFDVNEYKSVLENEL